MLPLANKIMIRLSTLVHRQLVIKMKDYIATFYTVYDAMVFQRILERRMSIPTKLMPVPRELSSSCGTCASFSCEDEQLASIPIKPLERLVQVVDGEYLNIADNR